jgi:hypothetical protein
VPAPHAHVSAESLWSKRSAHVDVQGRDLSDLGPENWNSGTAEIKTKSFSLWSPSSWGWWKRSTDAALQRRQDEDFQIDPELLAALGPGHTISGSTNVKTESFSLWSPSTWGWWKRSADAGLQRRQDEVEIDPELLAALGPSIQFGTTEVKTKAFDLWSPSTWGWWKRSADAGLQRRQEDVEVDPELLAKLNGGISFGTAEVKTKSFDLWSPSSWWGWWN